MMRSSRPLTLQKCLATVTATGDGGAHQHATDSCGLLGQGIAPILFLDLGFSLWLLGFRLGYGRGLSH